MRLKHFLGGRKFLFTFVHVSCHKMKTGFMIACLCFVFASAVCLVHALPLDEVWKHDPDIHRNVSLLISSKGYPVEEHTVQTKDGFLLGVQRIPHAKDPNQQPPNGQVVLMQHGLLSAASDFVLNFPKQSLGFILADAGYDVWLSNTRGNTYSRRHVKYTPKRKEFWNYSFDEMAEFDLTANIDYILNATGQKQLFYIGHSQGTTQAFALFSQSPEYNQKVKLFVALAPVATVGHMKTAIKYLAPFAEDLVCFADLFGIMDFLPNNAIIKFLSEFVCDNSHEKFLCEDIIFLLCGPDSQELNKTRVAVYTSHSPAGSSTKSVLHYGQMVNSKKFLKFDYGKKGNIEHYNQTTPPEYEVSKITTPVALMWSLNDAMADPTDVLLLQQKLRSLVLSYEVPLPAFNHLDYVYGVDANKLVYDEIQTLFKKYMD